MSSPASTSASDPPPLSALFLIEFDVKAGYTILWKRAVSEDIQLDDVVEFKSLPSGLHEVASDLVYFVHESGYAGLSAFANAQVDDEAMRNARMIAVGVLVPLSYGRLGRAWQHTAEIQRLAQQLAGDKTKISLLESYWKFHAATSSPDPNTTAAIAVDASNPSAPLSSPSATTFSTSTSLERHHPAHSLSRLLDSFGPLIFPLFRATLLRKRILISCHAPVHEVNDFVYDFSILSNIPSSVLDILPTNSPTQSLRPLFTVGVHDIPLLASNLEPLLVNTSEDSGSGWIACTTDSILACKQSLWDILVTIPPPATCSQPDIPKKWPNLQTSAGTTIKATQRDLRRYMALKAGLSQIATSASVAAAPPSSSACPAHSSTNDDISRPGSAITPPEASDASIAEIVEPMTWTALAYTGFMWWASAGEQHHSDELDEEAADAALLADLISPVPTPGTIPRYHDDPQHAGFEGLPPPKPAALETGQDTDTRVSLAIVAYFHRLTTQILSVAADVATSAAPSSGASDYAESRESQDSEDGDRADGGSIVGDNDGEALLALDDDDRDEGTRVGSHVLEAMGLDIWSVADTEFVNAALDMYFERSVYVETKGVEVCGVRVC
ncbi:Protein LCHN [Ceratocystis fimbriata CBS 114723]|uniref:Protein LCHN n=1 Tax=Ceratocystis fimbriata CBS 114723 TaxID=1035309 RepID=A0A2C5XHA9_9PEZI|nr:Protein LCHN [Ceratocystis fimbriata CBS 114723]